MTEGIKTEAWVICRDCDRVVEKIYCQVESHGKYVHQAIDKHRATRPKHTSFFVMPAAMRRKTEEKD